MCVVLSQRQKLIKKIWLKLINKVFSGNTKLKSQPGTPWCKCLS